MPGNRLLLDQNKLLQMLLPFPIACPLMAGNTMPGWTGGTCCPVHPHARGEHNSPSGALLLYCGSSPRAWGTQYYIRYVDDFLRFIPTRVGNTPGCGGFPMRVPVHPHARGEHSGLTETMEPIDGSSPRAWGTRRIVATIAIARRFIPTRVGNTFEI